MAKCKLIDPLHVIWHDGERWVEVEWPEDGRYDIGYQLALPTRKEGVADYMGLYESAVRRKVKDPLNAADLRVDRLDPRTVAMVGGDEDDVRRFIESDHKIRSGMCPNGHGLMSEAGGLQECPTCHFTTNVLAEKGAAS